MRELIFNFTIQLDNREKTFLIGLLFSVPCGLFQRSCDQLGTIDMENRKRTITDFFNMVFQSLTNKKCLSESVQYYLVVYKQWQILEAILGEEIRSVYG